MNCATYMCAEIVIEILSRLPAKSLIRFMAVCRLWKSIITSPQFNLLSNPPTKLLVHTARGCYFLPEDGNQNRLTFETNLPFKQQPNDSAPFVFGSDNGLLCIVIRHPYRVILWNPFIRKHVVVISDAHMNAFYEIAFGFGGYKYVRLVGICRDDEGRWKRAVDIYSLKAGTWRRKFLDSDITVGEGGQAYSCALVRGSLYWICGYRNKIYSFSLEDEVFENKIVVPESIQSHGVYVYGINVTVIRESLAVITSDEKGRHSTLCVWVMEKYGDVNSWYKLCNIVLEEHCCVERNMVHLMKDGEILLGLRGNRKPHKLRLVTYNPKTMKTRDFDGGSLSSSLSEVCGFTNYYKESLVLLGDHRAVHENQPTLQGL